MPSLSSLGRSIFEIGYELSPIILTNGIAQGFPGGMMPIVLLTQAANFVTSLVNGNSPFDSNTYFGHFRPLAGTGLINNELGKYPFANQTVAANAIITQPLTISMLMVSPVNQAGGYISKLVTFTALKTALDKHTQQGGTFTVATPSYIFTNCVLLRLTDVSSESSKQAQNAWRFDFERPLLALDEAQQVLGSLMSKISGGLPQVGTPGWSTVDSAIGAVKTGLGSLGTTITGLASFNLGSLSLPGGLNISSLANLNVSSLANIGNSTIGTAVSGIQSTAGGATGFVTSQATSFVSNLRLP